MRANDGIDWVTTQPGFDESEVSLLAQHTIKRLTSVESTVTAPFKYLDLPQEIRLAILGYTNLISPDAVQWRPRLVHLKASACAYCDDFGTPTMINEDDQCCEPYRISYIDKESTAASTQYYCCEKCSHDDHSRICYCSHRPATWSSSCNCSLYRRQAPFWVSRQVRWDAQAVYYNNNQVVVTPYNSSPLRNMHMVYNHWRYSGGTVGLSKVELSLYLSSISGHALYHIRQLEWILPYADRNYLLPDTRAWQDYMDTILLMEHAMNLTALTLTVNMSLSRCHAILDTSWAWWEMVVLPFRRLGNAGLHNFFVNLPRRHIDEGRGAHHERDLERAVMGMNYDSRERNKPRERIRSTYRAIRDRTGYDYGY